MQQLDERILEFVREEGWASPHIIAASGGFCCSVSEERIRERMAWLVYAGLLAPISGDQVDLTGAGARYLEGDLDARHQPRPAVEVAAAPIV